MHRSRRQFAGIFRLLDVLLRQILRPVVGYVAQSVKNALMNMDAVWNQTGAPQVNRDTALPMRSSLPRHGHGVEKKLRPEFAEPPESAQGLMQLPLGVRWDIRELTAQHVTDFLGIKQQPGGLCLAQHPAQRNFR